MKKNRIIDYTSLKISLILWIIMNITGYSNIMFNKGNIFIIIESKIFHLIFLYFIIYNFRRLYINRKKYKNEIIISIIFFIITFSFLLLTWPGLWSWDDISILIHSCNYELVPWQHFISSFFDIICLQTIPFSCGIIIMQLLISSMIVGYCISNIIELLNIKSLKIKLFITILLFIPCILPPVLEYLLSGYRMGIYSFIELLLIIKLFINYQKNEKICNREILNLTLLTIIVASWRYEGIYYIGSITLIFIFFYKKNIFLKKRIIISAIIIIIVFSINKINNSLIGNNNYQITATIHPVSELVKISDSIKDKKELNKLSRVINLSYIYRDSTLSGEAYYWNGIVKQNYTNYDYKNYMIGYFQLSLKYPFAYLKTMLDMFFKSSGLYIKNKYSFVRTAVTNTSGGALSLFTNETTSSNWFSVNSKFSLPINDKIREKTIRFIANIDENFNVTPLYYINWNLIIPISLLIIILIILLIKKQWMLSVLALTIFIRAILIFLTASAPYFMYYLSVYLVGYIYSFIIICKLILDKRERDEK